MTNLEHLSTDTLADYAEGLLRESEAAAVAAHLDGCADCRAEEMLLASLSTLLAADNPGPMPAVYAARIDAALAEVAIAHPVSGSFHPEGAEPSPALDLTPSAFGAAAAGSQDAEVIDLAARRRVVAQGLSRVTTVAASIVLLIGGTVLGLQALNTGDNATTNPEQNIAQPTGSPETIRPSVMPRIKNPAVKLDKFGKFNPADNSWTNRSGTVIRNNGDAVTVDGQVLKARKTPLKDPGALAGPLPADPPVAGKGGGIALADGKTPKPIETDPSIPVEPSAPPATTPSTPAAEPTAAATAPEATSGTETTEGAKAAAVPEGNDAAQAKAEDKGAEPPAAKPAAQQPDAYVGNSRTEYNDANFAKKVLDLLEERSASFQESSTGTPQPDVDDAPAPSPESSVSAEPTFKEASIAAEAGSAPTTADDPDDVQGVDEPTTTSELRGPAPARIKDRVERCSQEFGGALLAGDRGTWDGKAATILVMTDPTDETGRQVIGRVVYGSCTPGDPANSKDNLRHVQTVVWRQ